MASSLTHPLPLSLLFLSALLSLLSLHAQAREGVFFNKMTRTTTPESLHNATTVGTPAPAPARLPEFTRSATGAYGISGKGSLTEEDDEDELVEDELDEEAPHKPTTTQMTTRDGKPNPYYYNQYFYSTNNNNNNNKYKAFGTKASGQVRTQQTREWTPAQSQGQRVQSRPQGLSDTRWSYNQQYYNPTALGSSEKNGYSVDQESEKKVQNGYNGYNGYNNNNYNQKGSYGQRQTERTKNEFDSMEEYYKAMGYQEVNSYTP